MATRYRSMLFRSFIWKCCVIFPCTCTSHRVLIRILITYRHFWSRTANDSLKNGSKCGVLRISDRCISSSGVYNYIPRNNSTLPTMFHLHFKRPKYQQISRVSDSSVLRKFSSSSIVVPYPFTQSRQQGRRLQPWARHRHRHRLYARHLRRHRQLLRNEYRTTTTIPSYAKTSRHRARQFYY